MEPLLYVMAILGCGEGDEPCRELALLEARYASEAQCLAASEEELLRRDHLAFPSVVAECRPVGAAPRLIRGRDIVLPEPNSGRRPDPRLATAERPRSSR